MTQGIDGILSVNRCRACETMWRIKPADKSQKCPNCGSERVAEVSVVGGAVEYVMADRSRGYALEDILLGKLAQWAGMITVNQYSDALNQQRQHVGRGGRVPPLGEVLIKHGALKRRQVEALLALRAGGWQDASEQEFEQIVLESGVLARERMLDGRTAQMAPAEKGETPPPLALVLYEKRLLAEKEIEALLQTQARRGTGLVAMALAASAEVPGSVGVEKLLGAKGSTQRKLRIAGMIAAVPILVLILYSIIGGRERLVETQCDTCTRTGYYFPVTSVWPQKCDRCGKHTVFPRALCLRCAEKFEVTDPNSPSIRCPHCGYDRYELLTNNLDEAKERERILQEAKKSSAGEKSGKPPKPSLQPK